MPKSKRRRKKAQNKTSTTASAPDLLAKVASNNGTVIEDNLLHKPRSFLEFIEREDGELIYQIVSFSPLLIGTISSVGLPIRNTELFICILVALACCQYVRLTNLRADKIPASEQLRIFFYWAILLVNLFFYYLSQNTEASVLLAATSILLLGAEIIEVKSKYALVLRIAALIFRMSALGILAVFSQTTYMTLSASIIGFVPATLLAAAEVAKYAGILEARGWQRNKEIVKKKNGQLKTIVRPAGLTQLFSLLLIAGPASAVTSVPPLLLPQSFLICAIPLYFVPSLAQEFQQSAVANKLAALRALKLSGLSAICILIACLI